MTTEIRPYQKQDLPDLLNSWESASRLAHPFMTEKFFQQERKNIPELYIPNTDTWVVLVDEVVVGFIALIVADENSQLSCEIGGLFVEPSFHRQKFGKTLLDKAKQLYGELAVKVFKENHIGSAFYHKYDFEFVSELIWDDTGDVLIEMKLV